MKVTWLQNFDNKHKDSVWYGGEIVSVEIGAYTITIGAYGDVRAIINDEYYVDKCNGGNFAEYLREQGIEDDDDLRRADKKGRIKWENNNWFEAVFFNNDTQEYLETYDTIVDELDENDDFEWLKDWLDELLSD